MSIQLCTGVPEFNPITTTSTKVTTTPTPTNGIANPSSTQPGMVSNCDAFHFVLEGGSCAAIASRCGISVAQFNTWNPLVGSNCAGLWKDVYVCVSIIGVQRTSVAPTVSNVSPTSTKPTNVITTPTPTQPGMVANCDKFYFVTTGSTCSGIINSNQVTLSDFVKWNPNVGSDCSGMWANVYVCVRTIGFTAPTSSKTTFTHTTTTTKTTNGVTTPTPTQPSMVATATDSTSSLRGPHVHRSSVPTSSPFPTSRNEIPPSEATAPVYGPKSKSACAPSDSCLLLQRLPSLLPRYPKS